MNKQFLAGALSLAALLPLSGVAHAAACANGTSPMDTTDVTINNNVSTILASDCKYYPSANNVDPFTSPWGTVNQIGSNINVGVGAQNEPIAVGPNTGSITVSPDPSPLQNVGNANWDITWTGGPWLLDLVVVVKQSNAYGAYWFNDLLLSPANSGYTNPGGTWKVALPGLNAGQLSGVSHLAFYYGDLRYSNGGGGGGSVPEPAPIALMGAALAGMAWLRRRSQAKQAS